MIIAIKKSSIGRTAVFGCQLLEISFCPLFLDYDFELFWTMASDNALSEPVDLESSRTCLSCSLRMSSMLHDRHSVCMTCRGGDCTFDEV